MGGTLAPPPASGRSLEIGPAEKHPSSNGAGFGSKRLVELLIAKPDRALFDSGGYVPGPQPASLDPLEWVRIRIPLEAKAGRRDEVCLREQAPQGGPSTSAEKDGTMD